MPSILPCTYTVDDSGVNQKRKIKAPSLKSYKDRRVCNSIIEVINELPPLPYVMFGVAEQGGVFKGEPATPPI